MSQPCNTVDPAQPGFLTRQEAADYLSVGVQTIDRYATAGLLPRYRLPSTQQGGRGAVRYRADDVRKLAQREGDRS